MGIDFPAEGGAEFVSTVWMSCQLVVLSTPSDERDTVGLLAARVMRPLLGSRAVGIPLQRARYRLRVVFLLLGWRSGCANRPAHHQGVQRWRSWWPSLLFLLVDERCGVPTETCLFTGYRATKVLCSLRRGVFLHLARSGDCGNFASAKVPVMVDVVAAPHLCKPRAAGACFDTWCWWPRCESAKPGVVGGP
jgi:hypothetical protein